MTLAVALVVGCAPAPRAPDEWERKYGARKDCRDTIGTECFEYFKLARKNPHPICQAESAYPANMRRSTCYGTFQVADPGFIDPFELERVSHSAGPDRLYALGTLFSQASRGDLPSRSALRRLALDDPDLPRRAEALSWLAERGDDVALAALARGVLEAEPRQIRLDWLPQLARLRGGAAGKYLLDAMASPDTELSRVAMAYAQSRTELPRDQFWRAAFLAAKRANAEECRRFLRDHLQTKPKDTLRALALLVSDPDVGPIADGLLTMVLAGARESFSTVPDSRMREVAFWARAGRLPTYLPEVEDEREVMRRGAEGETDELSGLRLNGRVALDPSAPSRLYVGTESDRLLRDGVLLLEIRDSAGRSRWAQAEQRVVGVRDYCEPLPGSCHFPSWLPEGSYLVFSDLSDAPLFPASGKYALSFESAFRTFRYGPITFDAPAPASRPARSAPR